MISKLYRPDKALLAGVCAELARRLGWNVWAIRVLFVFGLYLKVVPVAITYLVLAVFMGLLFNEPDSKSAPGGLASESLSERGKRIDELERKFKNLDKGHQ